MTSAGGGDGRRLALHATSESKRRAPQRSARRTLLAFCAVLLTLSTTAQATWPDVATSPSSAPSSPPHAPIDLAVQQKFHELFGSTSRPGSPVASPPHNMPPSLEPGAPSGLHEQPPDLLTDWGAKRRRRGQEHPDVKRFWSGKRAEYARLVSDLHARKFVADKANWTPEERGEATQRFQRCHALACELTLAGQFRAPDARRSPPPFGIADYVWEQRFTHKSRSKVKAFHRLHTQAESASGEPSDAEVRTYIRVKKSASENLASMRGRLREDGELADRFIPPLPRPPRRIQAAMDRGKNGHKYGAPARGRLLRGWQRRA